MIARADKGKTTVIMYTQDYTKKVHNFLSENNFHALPNNPTHKDNKSIHKALQKCEKIIDKKHIKYPTQKKLLTAYTQCPAEITKKPNNPIRPVVNNRTAPPYKTAKKLNTILNNHLHLENQYNATNSNILAEELTQMKINDRHILLTLDIKDLYVNIPIKETISIIKTQLLMHNDK
jgi:hypothetical protein